MLHAVHLGGSASGGALVGGGGSGRGRWGLAGGGGQATFQSSCHILHYHMVLSPEGTSHNYSVFGGLCAVWEPCLLQATRPLSDLPHEQVRADFTPRDSGFY